MIDLPVAANPPTTTKFDQGYTTPSGIGPKSTGRARRLENLRPAPPAENRNTRAAKHYGRAEKVIPGLDQARQDLLGALADRAPVRDANGALPAADEPLVELAARELARARAIDAWLQQHGYFARGGKLRPAVEYLEKATKTAAELLDRLGMSPRSRARLGLDMARTVDLATALSEPDPERRRELLKAAGLSDD